jgi:pimeloyl-ACP methyl ester carboxylesterase
MSEPGRGWLMPELASSLRDPEVVILDGVGHLPNLERPGDLNERLLSFLNRARP